MGIGNTNGFKAWGITINTPDAAPNTDGVDPQASRNGIIAYNKITTGDDNIAIKGSGPVTNLVIAHNHFGTGHGMSIGSETNGGVSHVRVCDLSLDGTHNGRRNEHNGSDVSNLWIGVTEADFASLDRARATSHGRQYVAIYDGARPNYLVADARRTP